MEHCLLVVYHLVADGAHAGKDRSHRENDGLFSSDGPDALLRARIQVHVEEFNHILRSQLAVLFQLDQAFDSFEPTEENESVLEALPLLEVFEIDDVSFVGGAKFEIVPTFVGAFLEHCLEAFSYAHVVAPVGASLQERLLLTHNFARVV